MEDKSEQDKIKNEQEEKALNQNRKELVLLSEVGCDISAHICLL